MSRGGRHLPGKHRGAGRAARLVMLLAVLRGELGPGPQAHVAARYVTGWLYLASERERERA